MNSGKKIRSTPREKHAPPGTPAKHATLAPTDLVSGLWAGLGGVGGGNTPVPGTPVKGTPVAAAPKASPQPAINTQAAADNTSRFTKEQDDELLRRKTEGETWAEIVTAMGKEKSDLAKRFGQIKPAGWKPNPVDKGKNKGKKKGDQEQKKGEEKPPQEPTGNNGLAGNDWDLTKINMGNLGAAGNANPWAVTGVPNNVPMMGQVFNQNLNPNPHAIPDWTQAQANNVGNQPDPNKHDHTQRRSRSEKSNNGAKGHHSAKGNGAADGNHAAGGRNGGSNPNLVPVNFFNDVYPDEQFSVDDLARISRILKRDHEQVWFRLSCAFKDKTGRHIHPDVFRQKLLGKDFKKGGVGGG